MQGWANRTYSRYIAVSTKALDCSLASSGRGTVRTEMSDCFFSFQKTNGLKKPTTTSSKTVLQTCEPKQCHMLIYTNIHYACICIHTYTHLYTYTRIRVYMSSTWVCTYLQLYTCTYMCTLMCVDVCLETLIYMYLSFIWSYTYETRTDCSKIKPSGAGGGGLVYFRSTVLKP